MDVDVSPLVVSAPTVASKLPVAVVAEAAASKLPVAAVVEAAVTVAAATASATGASVSTNTASSTTTSFPDFLNGGKRSSSTDNVDKKAPLSKEEQLLNQRKKEQWARNQTKCSIRFDNEKIPKSIVSISGLNINKFVGKMLLNFCRGNNIEIANKKTRKDLVIQQIIKDHTSEGMRKKIGAATTQKSSSTRPTAALLDSTLFRVIIVVTLNKTRQTYLKTCDKLSQKELDAKKGHHKLWEELLSVYEDDTLHELNNLGCYPDEPDGKGGMMNKGATIGADISDEKNQICMAKINPKGMYLMGNDGPATYDNLDVDEFAATIKFINHQYDGIRKKKNKSGNHMSFEEFCGPAKGFLSFYHHKLAEINCKDLWNSAYVQLNGEVFSVSCNGSNANSSRNSSSPTPSDSSQGSKNNWKRQIDDARKAAADSIATKNRAFVAIAAKDQKTKNQIRLGQLESEAHAIDVALNEVRAKIRMNKNDGNDKAKYAHLTQEKRFQKKARIRVESYLIDLKKEMKYVEPAIEDSSDSQID